MGVEERVLTSTSPRNINRPKDLYIHDIDHDRGKHEFRLYSSVEAPARRRDSHVDAEETRHPRRGLIRRLL